MVLLDLGLPRKSGLDVLKTLRAGGADLPVVVITARDGVADRIAGLDAGADDYIVKPFEREELHARVQVGFRMLELQAALADRVRELEEALTRVKQLQGLLPICSYCKKVRDDQNYWQQVETYIEGHSDAQFTHGICPDCRQKYVEPELDRLRKIREARGAEP
jgi:DNA-binding response OmpR family regulator